MRESLKSAAIGFAGCALVVVVIYAALLLFSEAAADRLIAQIDEPYPGPERELREHLRSNAGQTIKFFLPLLAVHWLLAGLFGRGKVSRSTTANVLLLGGMICIYAPFANTFWFNFETYCDQIPFLHQGFQILKIDECPSSGIFLPGAFLVGIMLIVVSAVWRVWASRRFTKPKSAHAWHASFGKRKPPPTLRADGGRLVRPSRSKGRGGMSGGRWGCACLFASNRRSVTQPRMEANCGAERCPAHHLHRACSRRNTQPWFRCRRCR